MNKSQKKVIGTMASKITFNSIIKKLETNPEVGIAIIGNVAMYLHLAGESKNPGDLYAAAVAFTKITHEYLTKSGVPLPGLPWLGDENANKN